MERHLAMVTATVHRVASRTPSQIERCDLEAAGIYGLLKAIDGFDPTRGAKLSSYCQLRIYGAIIDELRSQDWVSRPSRQRGTDFQRASSELKESLGREPSVIEISQKLGIAPEEVRRRMRERCANQWVSLEALGLGQNAEDVAVVDVRDEPLEVAHRRDLWALIWEQLTQVERTVVDLHYRQNLKLKQVAQALNISSSRATQVHSELLHRLKGKLSQEPV